MSLCMEGPCYEERSRVFYAMRSAEAENARLREALELIAAGKRPDGTYNRDREACEQIARDALWPKGEK
jgi:hypothetical protein